MRQIVTVLTLAVLYSCSGHVSKEATVTDDTTAVQDTVINQDKTIPKSAPDVDDKSFQSAEDAYDEGYYNGQQEGYSDAIHHFSYGYYYDDEPEYTGFSQYYEQGYEDGYIDGYNEGNSQQ